MRVTPKLALLFAGVGLIGAAVSSYIDYVVSERMLRDAAMSQLNSVRTTKARHLENYFDRLRGILEALAAEPTIIQAAHDFRLAVDSVGPPKDLDRLRGFYGAAYKSTDDSAAVLFPTDTATLRLQELYIADNPNPPGEFERFAKAPDGSPYSQAHGKYHELLRRYCDGLRFADLMICDLNAGRVVYSVKKNPDFGALFTSRMLSPSNLRAVSTSSSKDGTRLADFQRYIPTYDAPAAFMSTPIRMSDGSVATLVVRISLEEINKILTGNGNYEGEGFGETGETLLVGPDGTLRNDSRYLSSMNDLLQDLSKEGLDPQQLDYIRRTRSTVLAFQVKALPFTEAIAGIEGTAETKGFRGRRILASFGPVNILGVRWGMVCKIEVSEAFAGLSELRNSSLRIGVGILLITFLVSLLVSWSINRPIKILADAAKRFGKGEKNVRTNLTSKDEFGELGRAFDIMVAETEQMDQVAHSIRRNIVHDLKTPVAVVKGMAETLRDPEIVSEVETRTELVDAIVDESDRLLDDLKDILAPIDVHYQPAPEPFDMSVLVEGVVRREKHTTRAANHQIDVIGTEIARPVIADRRKIRRVVENLLSNAVKYSPGENKRVVVEVDDAGPGKVVIRVKDEGLGMRPDQLAKVLGEGGRIEDHAHMPIEGTGLGLGSVRVILAAHHGELLATSEVNKGSEFSAILPKIYSPGPKA